jgi:hypothetical protein
MKYFNGITDIEQAKLRYRKLAKQLHPDKGGTAVEFQNMRNEYQTLLLKLQQSNSTSNPPKQVSLEKELITELGHIAKVLIKKQVPQNYLKQKIQSTQSPLKKSLFGNLVDLLDSLK